MMLLVVFMMVLLVFIFIVDVSLSVKANFWFYSCWHNTRARAHTHTHTHNTETHTHTTHGKTTKSCSEPFCAHACYHACASWAHACYHAYARHATPTADSSSMPAKRRKSLVKTRRPRRVKRINQSAHSASMPEICTCKLHAQLLSHTVCIRFWFCCNFA